MELTTLALLFMSATKTFDLPKGLLPALCYVESHHRVDAINPDDGKSESLGICQIKLNTAKMMGFKGSKRELMKPTNNIKYAAKYLKYQLNRYDASIPKAVAAYNAGSYIKKNDKAVNESYVRKVFLAWLKLGKNQ